MASKAKGEWRMAHHDVLRPKTKVPPGVEGWGTPGGTVTMRPERGKRGASEAVWEALWAGRTLMGAIGCATGRFGGQERPLPKPAV